MTTTFHCIDLHESKALTVEVQTRRHTRKNVTGQMVFREMKAEAMDWLWQNCKQDWYIGYGSDKWLLGAGKHEHAVRLEQPSTVFFADKDEAMLFKLTWGGK